MCCSPPAPHSQCLQTMCLTSSFHYMPAKKNHPDLCAKRSVIVYMVNTSSLVFGLYTSMHKCRVRIIFLYLKNILILTSLYPQLVQVAAFLRLGTSYIYFISEPEALALVWLGFWRMEWKLVEADRWHIGSTQSEIGDSYWIPLCLPLYLIQSLWYILWIFINVAFCLHPLLQEWFRCKENDQNTDAAFPVWEQERTVVGIPRNLGKLASKGYLIVLYICLFNSIRQMFRFYS